MRMTVELDDDIVDAAEKLAQQRGLQTGAVISNLVRRVLALPESTETRSSVPLVPIRPDSKVVTLELVNRIRDDVI